MFEFCLEGSISWGRRMPIFRGYPGHCTINGSWITSPSAIAAVSRHLPHSKRPLEIGTFMQALGRRSKYPDEISDLLPDTHLPCSKVDFDQIRPSFLSMATSNSRVLRHGFFALPALNSISL